MNENADRPSYGRGRGNWRSRGRGGRYNHAAHTASEECGDRPTPQSCNSNAVSPRGDNVCERRGWRPRGRNGRYNHAKHSAYSNHDSMQMFQSSDVLRTTEAESASTHNAVPSVGGHSSLSLTAGAGHNFAHRPSRRSRGNRRPWRARGINRPDSVPSVCEADCSSFQQMEGCSSSSSSPAASTADASESVDENAQLSSSIVTLGKSTVISNRGKNAQQQGYKRNVHSNRGHSRSRYPLHQQSHSRSIETSETQYKMTGSSSSDHRMLDELESELVEVDDESVVVVVDDDVIEARKTPVTGKGKHKNLSVRSRGVHGNKRGHSRAGRIDKYKETAHVESSTYFIPVESSVSDAITEQDSSHVYTGNKSGGHQKKITQRAASSHLKCEIADTASVTADDENDAAVRSAAAAADVKLANVDKHRKHSESKPSVHVDENSLFWHLVNEYKGKCCIDELKNQLNTSDADDAIAILHTLKRVKVLVNETDKWKSVAVVFLKGLRMCLHVRAGCKKEDCTFLHVCPDLVSESCQHGDRCCFGHNVKTPTNAFCLQNSAIPDSCSSESVLTIARCSNPIICAEYNDVSGPNCCSPVQCIRLHVCNNFFRGRCLVSNSECTFGHELKSHHNERLLTLYEVKHLLSNDKKLQTLHRMILPFNITAHLLTHTRATQQRGKPHISNFIDMMQLATKNRVQVNEDKMKSSADHLVTTDAFLTKPALSQAKHAVMLQRFTISQDLASKTSSVPAISAISVENQSTMSIDFSQSVQEKTNQQTASTQSAGTEVTAVKSSQLPSDRNESAQMLEAAISRQLNAMQRSSDRRSQSNKSLEFRDNQCQVYVKHLCNESKECSVRHDLLPYLWRVQDAGKWVPFEDSVSIEKDFCSPDNMTHAAIYKGTSGVMNRVNINFNKMECSAGKVQRLSAPSYVTCRTQYDATRWLWYWNCGDFGRKLWVQYEDKKPPYQDVLEARFLADAEQNCCFECEEFQYELSFTTMMQTNVRTKTKREVCRRPCFVSELDLSAGGLPPALFYFSPHQLPANEGWLPMDTETSAWTELVPISSAHRSTQEMYVHVTAEFHATLSPQDYTVCRIYRVQNLDLWNKYQNMKSKMEKLPHLATVGVNEQKLFHGTPDEATVRCICHQNFDPRMHGRHGTVYGKGVYFSTTAKYSDQYTRPCAKNSGHRFMFFGRVLVGMSAVGRPELQRPPPVDVSRPHGALYDSCVNHVSVPSIFVIFDNDQCYPEFLIEYEVFEKVETGDVGTLSRRAVRGSAAYRSAANAAMFKLARDRLVAAIPTTVHSSSTTGRTAGATHIPVAPALQVRLTSQTTGHLPAVTSEARPVSSVYFPVPNAHTTAAPESRKSCLKSYGGAVHGSGVDATVGQNSPTAAAASQYSSSSTGRTRTTHSPVPQATAPSTSLDLGPPPLQMRPASQTADHPSALSSRATPVGTVNSAVPNAQATAASESKKGCAMM